MSMPIGTTHLKPKLMLYEDATLVLSKKYNQRKRNSKFIQSTLLDYSAVLHL